MKRAAGLLVVAALVACSAVKPPVPNAEVCAHLAAIGCKEGTTDNCSRLVVTRMTDFPLACWAAAADKAAARACGQLDCP